MPFSLHLWLTSFIQSSDITDSYNIHSLVLGARRWEDILMRVGVKSLCLWELTDSSVMDTKQVTVKV